ncbi:integrator complex subunit 2-like [Ylistrum balloti]|uniref:integrator complex subunit 2-like n=1 Tax=Ylistrum balloti TaxID=509963 RepID=UPI002905A479|nr:integrator complex subunit 2-like [Ylistrum balloti]
MQSSRTPVKPEVFQAMQDVNINVLSRCTERELRPVLPCLVRMALCKPLDESSTWTKSRKEVLKILNGIEVVNSIVALLSIDFNALEQDVIKEQQLRSKFGGSQTESVLIAQLQNGPALEFERSDPARRIRLLLSELLFVMSQIKETRAEFYQKQSELFESHAYLEELSDVLCIAQAELPSLLPVVEVSEALLHVPNGSWLLCRLISNAPDSFKEVCASLVGRGERQEEESLGGRRRMELLLSLCAMNPGEAFNIRALCVEHCTMPGLAVSLSLKMSDLKKSDTMTTTERTNDMIAFISGLLLGNDIPVRSWFSLYIKAGQKRKREPSTSSLHCLRLWLLERLISILPDNGSAMSESSVIQASAFVRLYCALKGMATLRFSEEEMKLLLRLVTSRPPLTPAGARFVSLGLCMLIACPYLLGSHEQEKQAIEWIRWLMGAEKEFEMEGTHDCSFGEMLFLIAIHFHNNATPAIADLVCNTLGMKSAVKANALARMRQIFTQEIFTEQVITSHAVKVPVTTNLNANMTGYLPINSVYQLLRSRAFSKHKVNIKDWIYRQIRVSSCPLHPLLPLLVEVYVNSIVVKSTKTDHLNEPMSDEDVLAVYQESVFNTGSDKMDTDDSISGDRTGSLAPQLLMLYYILLYEDTILNSMKIIVSSNREVKSYPDTLLSQIPINYLLQQAQIQQHQYAGLFSPLLRLLATHYPHLCAVEDWLQEIMVQDGQHSEWSPLSPTTCTVESLNAALQEVESHPAKAVVQLQALLRKPTANLLPFSDTLVGSLPVVLAPGVPRRVQDMVKTAWFKLHTISPRMLRLATVNAMTSGDRKFTPNRFTYTENDITVDPLIVLRCSPKVFRCPPILEVMLRVLNAYVQGCRVYLQNHMTTNPILDHASHNETERRDLKNALIAAQESAVVQILLECCLSLPEEQEDEGLLNNRREVQCIICPFIHQMFISDPNLAKLVHFQGYSDEILPVAVAGIPSMHICLDFVPELLSQPQIEKQIFAIKLTSHLCCHYALPKSLSVAKLVMNVMFTMIEVLDGQYRAKFLVETVPCLVRVCQAFPPLCEDATTLLGQVGRICISHLTSSSNVLGSELIDPDNKPDAGSQSRIDGHQGGLTAQYQKLYKIIQTTFSGLVSKALVTRNIYS